MVKMFLMFLLFWKVFLVIFVWPGISRAGLEGRCPLLGTSTLIPDTAGPRASVGAFVVLELTTL